MTVRMKVTTLSGGIMVRKSGIPCLKTRQCPYSAMIVVTGKIPRFRVTNCHVMDHVVAPWARWSTCRLACRSLPGLCTSEPCGQLPNIKSRESATPPTPLFTSSEFRHRQKAVTALVGAQDMPTHCRYETYCAASHSPHVWISMPSEKLSSKILPGTICCWPAITARNHTIAMQNLVHKIVELSMKGLPRRPIEPVHDY